jgi:serine/threonine-protein kinase RsbT
VSDLEEVEIASDEDVVRVRQAVRAIAVAAGLSLVDQTKMVTAASELARNTLLYGGGGVAELELLDEMPARKGVRATFIDEGPGIHDVELAMRDGYSSGTGLGLGLSGARRLVDEFVIESERDAGTRVCITKWGR